MKIKGITDEDFVNYKIPSMFIAMPYCTFKCDIEYGSKICQNSSLAKQPDIEIQTEKLIERYLSNKITKAIVFGGLEPFNSTEEMFRFIMALRQKECHDDVVIYTGYTKEELQNAPIPTDFAINIIEEIRNTPELDNIIIKFGRYIPDCQPHFDPVLGVNLASDNQYAERIC